jgi:hypothetical protein
MGAQLIQQGQTIFSTMVMSWINIWNGVIMPQSHAPKNEKNKIMLQESYPFQLRANDSISFFLKQYDVQFVRSWKLQKDASGALWSNFQT